MDWLKIFAWIYGGISALGVIVALVSDSLGILEWWEKRHPKNGVQPQIPPKTTASIREKLKLWSPVYLLMGSLAGILISIFFGFVYEIIVFPPGEKCPQTLYLSSMTSNNQDPAADTNVWNDIANELQSKLQIYYPGTQVQLIQQLKYGDQISGLQHGSIQIAALSSGTAATAALDPRCHFFPGMVICDTNNLPLKYTATFIINKKGLPANITCDTVPQLYDILRPGGYPVAVGNWPSLSSYTIPMLEMNGSKINRIKTNLSQWELIDAVRNNKFFAACVASDVLERHFKSNKNDRELVKPLDWGFSEHFDPAWTNSFPSYVIGWRTDLPVLAQLCIANTLNNYSWKSNPLNPYSEQVRGFHGIDDFLDMWKFPIEITQQARTNSFWRQFK